MILKWNVLPLSGNYACILFTGFYSKEGEKKILSQVSTIIYNTDHLKIKEYNVIVGEPNEFNCIYKTTYDRDNPDGLNKASSQKQILYELELFLEEYSVTEIFTWNKMDYESYRNVVSDIAEHSLTVLMSVNFLKDILDSELKNTGIFITNINLGMKKWMELYNLKDLEENIVENKGIKMFSQILTAYLANRTIDINKYQSFKLEKDKLKINEEVINEDIGFCELEYYLSKKLIKKAANIAGCSSNRNDFRRNLKNGKFTDEQCLLLLPYFPPMRIRYLKKIGHKSSEKIMRYTGNYPIFIVEKVIPTSIFLKAKKIAMESVYESIYISKLKNLTHDEKQLMILKQCYNALRKMDMHDRANIIKNKNYDMKTYDFKSYNAVSAEKKGLFTLSEVSEDMLLKYDFNYGVKFFKWLCQMRYVTPKEFHHTGIDMNSTGYYNEATITYVVEHYDLIFLYKLYTKEIDLAGALEQKHISFCFVEAVSTLIGIEKGNPVKIYCIKQNNTFWFSKRKYLKRKDGNIRIITEWKYPTSEFKNKNYKAVMKMLLSRKKIKIVRNYI